jgi:ring-1,2-phenylacetyl-CoA epoxidase subunit PaaE
MSDNYQTLKIINIRKETSEATSLSFDVPQNLQEKFKYHAGQYINIRTDINGQKVIRTFSISSCMLWNEPLTITIKRSPYGVISNYLLEKIGNINELEVSPPTGNFILNPESENILNYVMIAAGSGIAPIFSLIKEILISRLNSNILLIYQNHSENSVIFKNEIEEINKAYSERFLFKSFVNEPDKSGIHVSGKIDKFKINDILNNYKSDHLSNSLFYLCGPPGFMDEVKEGLNLLNVSKESIKIERFVAAPGKKIEESQVEKGITRNVKIILNWDENEIDVEPEDTILTAALMKGLEPPHSCTIGACGTCRAQLISGKVKMDEHEALTDEEIEEGQILTCQAHPLTDDVVVSYDDI